MYLKSRLLQRFPMILKDPSYWFWRCSALIQKLLKPRNPPMVFLVLWDIIFFQFIEAVLSSIVYCFLFRLFWLCAFCPKRLFIQWLCSRIRICFKLEESGFWAESCFFGTMRLFRKNRINFRKRDLLYFQLGRLWFPSLICILWSIFGVENCFDFVLICYSMKRNAG